MVRKRVLLNTFALEAEFFKTSILLLDPYFLLLSQVPDKLHIAHHWFHW